MRKFICVAGMICCLSACASDGSIDSQAEYEQATPRSSSELIVPPGLSTPKVDDTYSMLHGVASAGSGGYQLDKLNDMSINEAGTERWLVVKNTTVDHVFPLMLSYIRQNGMRIKYQSKSIGLIQTAWFNKNAIESRGVTRQFFDWIGLKHGVQAMPSLYTFRVNLWQNGTSTEIFVTDYQMDMREGECRVETATKAMPLSTNTADLADYKNANWVSVPSDPQLELDFLLQFMAYAKSGADTTQEKVSIAPTNLAVTNTTVASNAPEDKLVGDSLTLYDTFDRAWWRTSLALERVGLGSADKDRSRGEFYVYPLQSDIDNPQPSTFERWFGDDKSTLQLPKAKYTVKLVAQGNNTTLMIEPYAEAPADKDFAKNKAKYLADLAKQLR